MSAKTIGHSVFAVVLFAFGTAFGALFAATLPGDEREGVFRLAGAAVSAYSSGTSGQAETVRQALANSFVAHWKWIAVIALSGLSVVGLPVGLFLGFLKGALLGFSVACLVSRGTAESWLIALAAVVPQNLIAVPAVVLMCAVSSAFAVAAAKETLAPRRRSLKPHVVRLAVAFAGLTVLALVAAAIETFVSPTLLRWAVPPP